MQNILCANPIRTVRPVLRRDRMLSSGARREGKRESLLRTINRTAHSTCVSCCPSFAPSSSSREVAHIGRSPPYSCADYYLAKSPNLGDLLGWQLGSTRSDRQASSKRLKPPTQPAGPGWIALISRLFRIQKSKKLPNLDKCLCLKRESARGFLLFLSLWTLLESAPAEALDQAGSQWCGTARQNYDWNKINSNQCIRRPVYHLEAVLLRSLKVRRPEWKTNRWNYVTTFDLYNNWTTCTV